MIQLCFIKYNKTIQYIPSLSFFFRRYEMKYSPDAYLLHEANNFITFNIRFKVILKDPVDAKALTIAAEKAFTRFPYYSKQIHIDEDGGIDLIPNPRTIRVSAVSSKRIQLFSEEVNYQPCSIQYEDNCIYFNMYHGMCGGCGTSLWVKTTIYEYICTRYGVCPDPGNTLMTDTPVLESEYAFPSKESIPEDAPISKLKKDEVWFPGPDYLLGFANLVFSDSIHYELEIPKQELMQFIGENDGSPMSVIAAVMVKALHRALPKNKLPFRFESNHNYRSDVGCSNTHHDLLTHLFFLFPQHVQTWPIHKICTIIRGATHLQSQPEYGYETLRRFYAYVDAIDQIKGLKEKKKYASKFSHRVPEVKNSVLINYTGREDWGSMTDYVERVHVITDAHLLFEILDVGDKFCITLMQMTKTSKYLDCFCQILDEEKISYKVHGIFKNQLPVSKVESAPMSAQQ